MSWYTKRKKWWLVEWVDKLNKWNDWADILGDRVA